MKTKAQSNGVAAKRMTVKGKRMVMLEETDFDRLLMDADLWEPQRPDPLPDGNYPAEVVRVDLAIDIIRERRALGWTQAELARRAGIRLKTLRRIEQGGPRPSTVSAIDKIDKALKEAGKGSANGK
jgi:DNA-binding XRE family transcriptional regulator